MQVLGRQGLKLQGLASAPDTCSSSSVVNSRMMLHLNLENKRAARAKILRALRGCEREAWEIAMDMQVHLAAGDSEIQRRGCAAGQRSSSSVVNSRMVMLLFTVTRWTGGPRRSVG